MDIQPYIREYGNPQAEITLICLHGWAQSHVFWEPLNELPFRILAFDLPGFGKTSTPSYTWGIEEYSHWLETVVREMNISNPILIGHSFGCRVAMKFAKNHPQTSCILISPSGIPHTAWKANLASRVGRVFPQLMYRTASQYKSRQWYVNNHEIAGREYQTMHRIFAKTHQEPSQVDLRTTLINHPIPTTIIVGDADTITPPDRVQKLAQTIPHSTVHTLPGNHFVLWQAPDAVRTLISHHIRQYSDTYCL